MIVRAWLASVSLAALAGAQTDPEVLALQLPGSVRRTGQLVVDVDGDGRLDLVLACFDEQAKRRELRVHPRGAGSPAFAASPSSPPYPLERDVIAFTFADVDARPGRDLVLFTAERAVAVLPGEGGTPTYAPLFEHRLLWPAPDRERVLILADVVHDVDGDGRDDFLLPEPDGARVVLQRRGEGPPAFAAPVLWSVPAWRSPLETAGTPGAPARIDDDELALRLNLGGEDAEGLGSRPLVQVQARAPRVGLVDLAGDGTPDGVALRNGALWSWPIGPSKVPAATATSVALPLPEDRLLLLDPAFDVQFADISGDRRADLVLTTSARRNDEIEVRIDLLVQRVGDPPFASKPDCRLRLQTLAMPPQLVDADGDGRLDLIAVTVRTDLLRSVGSTGGKPAALDAQLNVFRGDGTRFLVPAALNQQLLLPAGEGRGRQPFVHVVAGAGGKPGVLLLRVDDRIVRQPLQADGARLRLLPAVASAPIAATARLRMLANRRDAVLDDVLAVDDHELLHVRWR